MPDTKDLVTRIKDNTVESLKINEQIACATSKPITGLHWDKTRFVNNIGNNQLVIINSPDSSKMLISIFDLSKKTILSEHTLHFKKETSIASSVPLDNTNYIAIGDWYGQLLILDHKKMEIIATHQIAIKDHLGDHHVFVRKHNGRLYGTTGSSYSSGRVFFSVPVIPTLTPKIIKVDQFTDPHDVAMDAAGYAYFSGGKFAALTSDRLYHDNPPLSDLSTSLHLGSRVKLIQQETGDSYLAITNNDGRMNNGICIFIGGPAPQGIMRSQVHACHTFPMELITHMEILSEKDKLLIVTTNKATHIYDLRQNKVITSFKPMPNFRVVADGILFFYRHPEKSNEEFCILTTHKLQESNALAQVAHALQDDHSVSHITINGEVDETFLQTLMKRPGGFAIETPVVQKLIDQLSEIIKSQNQTLTLKNEECASLQKKLDTRNKEEKEMQSRHEQQIQKLTATFSDKNAEQEQMISGLKKELTENRSVRDSLQETLVNITQQYDSALTRLKKIASSKSLTEKINETKETISPELLKELVSDETNLCTISLIRFSEQKELKHYTEVLKTKGAILSVADLKMQISTSTSSHKEIQKNNLLVQAVQQLILDYVEGRLPPQVLESLKELIIPEIKEAINKGEPSWLKKLYLIKANDIKMALKKEFFSSHYSHDASALKEQFDQVVQDIAKNEEYALYHEYLNDGLLEKIRNEQVEDGCFNQLVDIIKEKISFNRIQLTEPQHTQAFQSLLANQKPEMVQFIHNKIVQYWENERQNLLNPDAAENNHLKAENAALKQRLSNTTQGAGTSDAAFFAQDTNANTQVANTAGVNVEPYEIFG